MDHPQTAEFTITVLPSKVRFGARGGESLMAAAQRAKIRWPTVCNGVAQCGVCYVGVLFVATLYINLYVGEWRTAGADCLDNQTVHPLLLKRQGDIRRALNY